MDEHTHIDEELEKRWSKWDIHNGYTEKAGHPIIHHGEDVDEILKNESLPRRVIAAGLHAGLTVILNVEKEEYYCSGAESIGWKVSQ